MANSGVVIIDNGANIATGKGSPTDGTEHCGGGYIAKTTSRGSEVTLAGKT